MENFKAGLRLGKMWTMQFFRDSKFFVTVLFSFLFLLVYISPLRSEAASSRYGIAPYILPLIYDMNTMHMIFVMILLVCDAPFAQKNYMFINIRASMKSCFIGKLIYLFFISIILQIVQFMLSVLLLIPYLGFSDNWGYILTKVISYGFSEPSLYESFAARISVITSYMGIEALLSQIILNISFTFMLGMIAFFLNGMVKRYAGPVVLVFIAIYDNVINAAGFFDENIYKLLEYSPVRLIKLSAIAENSRTVWQNIPIMWGISLLFIIFTYIFFKLRISERWEV